MNRRIVVDNCQYFRGVRNGWFGVGFTVSEAIDDLIDVIAQSENRIGEEEFALLDTWREEYEGENDKDVYDLTGWLEEDEGEWTEVMVYAIVEM